MVDGSADRWVSGRLVGGRWIAGFNETHNSHHKMSILHLNIKPSNRRILLFSLISIQILCNLSSHWFDIGFGVLHLMKNTLLVFIIFLLTYRKELNVKEFTSMKVYMDIIRHVT